MTAGPPMRASIFRWGTGVFLVALMLRLVFGRVIAGTYDYDEFVLLLLARDFAHGAVPYRDFMFFHPPGALVFLRTIEPLTSAWWPWARIATSVIDAATASLVFIVGSRAFDRRVGLAAGLAYAAAPLALVTSARVGQDPIITALGMLGVAALVTGPERRWAVAAGVCLALAVWIKYPALYFLPIYLFLAPRRFLLLILAGLLTLIVLFAPFVGQAHELYVQTVDFQRARWTMPLTQRVDTTAIFWIALNALAFPALMRRIPAWLLVGFGLGGLFVFVPQTYYHYFAPVVPFAALLTGLTVTRVRRWRPLIAATAVVLPSILSAAIIQYGGNSPFYVTAARLSQVEPTVRLLDARSTSAESVLADRFEYAYLARRQALDHYFWNVGVSVSAGELERTVDRARAVVLSSGASSGYPSGFTNYLNRRFARVHRPATTVWLIPRSRAKS